MVILTYLRGLEVPELDKEDLLVILLFERNKLKNSLRTLHELVPNITIYHDS